MCSGWHDIPCSFRSSVACGLRTRTVSLITNPEGFPKYNSESRSETGVGSPFITRGLHRIIDVPIDSLVSTAN